MDYILYQNNNSSTSAGGKWYARAAVQNMSFDELCRHIASHHRFLDRATVMAVVMALEDEVRSLLLEGRSVQIGEIGTLSLTIGSRGVDDPADFRADHDITAMRLNIFPGRKLRTKQLLKDAKFKILHRRKQMELPD